MYLPSNFANAGAGSPIRVYPILVNVGINEQAISSNLLGSDSLQKFINTKAIVQLKSYFVNAYDTLPGMK